ncbi:c-type cytochrome [Membranihabitans marinus]
MGCQSDGKNGGLSPKDALSSFELAEGFQIESVASEPLISDPIAMEIDEEGRMYVLEMHGYPLDLSGSGVVKLLSDTDGDGTMDQSQVFVDNLILPTGIMRWKQGILVTDPPNILYFEDKDRDGQADFRDTILTGFARTNPQHNSNTPIYGFDNWIYVGNESVYTAKVFPELFGGEGGDVYFPNAVDGPVLKNNAQGRSLRLKPDGFKLENLSSETQYGQSFDRWGRHLLVSNANHIYHEVMAAPYLQRNPDLLISDATKSIAAHGAAADVYPITKNPEHQLLTDLGVFTSACGVTAYLGGLFPSEYNQTAFVAEPVSNLVHVDHLTEDGASFKATRVFEEKEFLASTDPWFRPVSIYTGPDGALYIIDYYRQIIEHPEWMADDVIQSGALYNGNNQGRIYRITPKGTGKMDWSEKIDLSAMSTEELVSLLANPNIWFRKNAQRLLVDRQDQSAVELLEEMALSQPMGEARFHALWTLDGLDALSIPVISAALKDQVPGIRENAIVLSEAFLGESIPLQNILLSMGEDSNARVRFQLMCTLGYLSSSTSQSVRSAMLFDNMDDPWMQIAALSAPSDDNIELLSQFVRKYKPDNSAYAAFGERLTSMLVSEKNKDMITSWIRRSLQANRVEANSWQSAVIKGVVTGLKNKSSLAMDLSAERSLLTKTVFNDSQADDLRKNALDLLLIGDENNEDKNFMETAQNIVTDAESTDLSKVLSIRYLSHYGDGELTEMYRSKLTPTEPPMVQLAALTALSDLPNSNVVAYLIENWSKLTPELRDAAIDVMVTNDDRIKSLIEAMEAGIIDPATIGWGRSVELMAQQEDEVMRNRARALFTNTNMDTDRKDVIEKYQVSLNLEGQSENGKLVFEKNCSICHQVGGENGVAFGPDLKTIKNRRPGSILSDILDPNLSIADGYDRWKILLDSGETVYGVIASEAPNAITLRSNAGEEKVLPRSSLVEVTSTGTSLMPVGLENQIDEQGMADLLSFIKNGK